MKLYVISRAEFDGWELELYSESVTVRSPKDAAEFINNELSDFANSKMSDDDAGEWLTENTVKPSDIKPYKVFDGPDCENAYLTLAVNIIEIES